jgi:hypothetical protein
LPAQPIGSATHRQRNPFLPFHSIGLGGVVPAAVFGAEIVGDVGHVDQLVRILVRVLEGADDNVGAAADIGRHRRLGPHVFPALAVHAHLDTGLLGELLGVRHPHVFIALHKTLPAQHAQLGAFLGFQIQGRDGCGCRFRGGFLVLCQHLAGGGAGSEAGGHSQKIASIDIAHLNLLWLLLQSRPA